MQKMPAPRSRNVGGSGVGTDVPPPPLKPPPVVAVVLPQPMEMVLVSIVTAPVSARALPQPMVAPVFRVMLVSARIFPWNEVVVPRVAELPTCQKTFESVKLLLKTTDELLAVVSALPIWKTNSALGLPSVLRVRVPVS